MTEKEILEKVNWSIHINEMTKSINGDNAHININVLFSLLELYSNLKENIQKTIISLDLEIKELNKKYMKLNGTPAHCVKVEITNKEYAKSILEKIL